MSKLQNLFANYATPRNRKVLFVVLTLGCLAIAAGAPGAGSGIGGGVRPTFLIGF